MAEKPRVVLVDDDRDFLAIVRQWLQPRYDTVSFDDGEGLIEELPALRPDLLVLDVRLPGSSGYALCRGIRGDGRFRELPILFLTACAGDSDFLDNIDAGGSAYLTKPVGRRRLLRRIKELLPS